MENIPHGITIESYTVDVSAQARGAGGEGGVYSLHTYRDLCLIPVCRPVVQPPLEKTMTLDVEGMSGVADLSHGLTGYPIFKDREGTWQFWLDTDSYQEKINYYGPVGDRAYRELRDKLVSLMRSPYQTRIILDDEPNFYYIGRIWLDAKPTYQYDHAKFTLRYRLYPYKYLRNEYGSDWLWDTFRFTTDFADTHFTGSGMWNWDSFCFETDLATAKMKEVALKAGQTETFPLVFTDKPSAVFVSSTAKAAAKLADQNGGEYTLVKKDTHAIEEISSVMPMQTEIRYLFAIHKYPITLEAVYFWFLTLNTNASVMLTIYKKGSDVAIATGKGTITGDSFEVKIPVKAKLSPDTDYIFMVSGSAEFKPFSMVDDGSDDYFAQNEYFSQKPGESRFTIQEYYTLIPVFVGALEFYAGNGALLEPNTRTNIGTVGRNVDDSGMTVAVTAEEDTVVNIEYCPAYL